MNGSAMRRAVLEKVTVSPETLPQVFDLGESEHDLWAASCLRHHMVGWADEREDIQEDFFLGGWWRQRSCSNELEGSQRQKRQPLPAFRGRRSTTCWLRHLGELVETKTKQPAWFFLKSDVWWFSWWSEGKGACCSALQGADPAILPSSLLHGRGCVWNAE